jgi:hypothetical protein
VNTPQFQNYTIYFTGHSLGGGEGKGTRETAIVYLQTRFLLLGGECLSDARY